MAQTTIKTEQIAADAITGAKIADNAIDSEHYTDGSIDTAHYADNSITGAELADNIAIAGTLDVAGAVVFNEGSADVDFRVESNGNANMLFVDGGNNRVGIGEASPQKTLDVKGTFAISNSTSSYWDFDRDDSNGALKISDTGTERMRIDSVGNIQSQYGTSDGYGQTSGNGGLAYVNDTGSAGGGLIISMDSDNGWSPVYLNRFEWSTGKDNRMIQFCINGSGDTGYISYDGTNFVIGNVSDYRLKENIVSYSGGLAKINAISVKSFNKIAGVSSHITQEGFIAHELQEVIPLAVVGEKDAMTTNEDGETVPDYQTVSREILIPYLVSAIQELETRLKTLEDA